ncbi:MAG: mannitol-1-phosphate 5-dehydrogenase [Armatimonadetes bacterium]|nr:mannitol-1-phosphate 5-dehydrogenase [Armatimonadota bacterium]
MKKALQFGAGNIGRGFMGQLFSESGYEVVFVDVIPEVVRLLNERRRYKLRIAAESSYDVIVQNVRAIDGRDVETVSEELSTADLACTAVGVNALPAIVPAIAHGIEKRTRMEESGPLNIIICENLARADSFLRQEVSKSLPKHCLTYMEENIGFVMSVVARMVPFMTEEMRRDDSLLVVAEAYKRLPVDREAFIGPVPEIVGLEPHDNFQAYIDDKLFTHNCGHAVAAYLGYLHGHEYMYQVMQDERIRKVTSSALTETGGALIKKHGFNPARHQAHIDDLLERFGNVALGDQVARVGRDPLRKLGPDDRLAGAAKFTLSEGIFPRNVCKGIAAGLLFDPPGDPTALQIKEIIKVRGPEAALEEVCGLDSDSALARAVLDEFAATSNSYKNRST